MQVIGIRVGDKIPRGKLIASKVKQKTNSKERWGKWELLQSDWIRLSGLLAAFQEYIFGRLRDFKEWSGKESVMEKAVEMSVENGFRSWDKGIEQRVDI